MKLRSNPLLLAMAMASAFSRHPLQDRLERELGTPAPSRKDPDYVKTPEDLERLASDEIAAVVPGPSTES